MWYTIGATTTYVSLAPVGGAYIAPLDTATDGTYTLRASYGSHTATVITSAHAGATGGVFQLAGNRAVALQLDLDAGFRRTTASAPASAHTSVRSGVDASRPPPAAAREQEDIAPRRFDHGQSPLRPVSRSRGRVPGHLRPQRPARHRAVPQRADPSDPQGPRLHARDSCSAVSPANSACGSTSRARDTPSSSHPTRTAPTPSSSANSWTRTSSSPSRSGRRI